MSRSEQNSPEQKCTYHEKKYADRRASIGILCGDATASDAVARLCGKSAPVLMVCDPPYGISLDSEWRDRAGLNSKGAAQPSYMKHRTEGHTNTSISSDTRADWSEAFALLPSLQVAYVWHASVFTREVLDGLVRIGFLYPQQIIPLPPYSTHRAEPPNSLDRQRSVGVSEKSLHCYATCRLHARNLISWATSDIPR